MNRVKVFKLLLVSLIVLAYQFKSIHINHLIKKDQECIVCIVDNKISTAFNQISFIIYLPVLDNISIQKPKSNNRTSALSYKSIIQYVDFKGMRHYKVDKIPIGYFSNAPPHKYS